MATERDLSAEERQALIDRRLDELDRALLGILPRAERLALVATVEARVQVLGDAVSIPREMPAEVPAAALSPVAARSRSRRSRLAFSAGVLGIVAASCLVASPLLLIALSIFGELLGETFSIALFGVLTALVTLGGGLAVCGSGASLLRLARRGQSATGTGWAITGLCTGALPMLIGLVGLLTLMAQFTSSQTVEVTWNAGPAGPVPYQVAQQPYGYPAMLPPTQPLSPAPPPALPPVKPEAGMKAEPATTAELKPTLKQPAALEQPVELED